MPLKVVLWLECMYVCVRTHTLGNKKTIVYFCLAFEDVTDPTDLVSGLCTPIVAFSDGLDRQGQERSTAGILGFWG